MQMVFTGFTLDADGFVGFALNPFLTNSVRLLLVLYCLLIFNHLSSHLTVLCNPADRRTNPYPQYANTHLFQLTLCRYFLFFTVF